MMHNYVRVLCYAIRVNMVHVHHVSASDHVVSRRRYSINTTTTVAIPHNDEQFLIIDDGHKLSMVMPHLRWWCNAIYDDSTTPTIMPHCRWWIRITNDDSVLLMMMPHNQCWCHAINEYATQSMTMPPHHCCWHRTIDTDAARSMMIPHEYYKWWYDDTKSPMMMSHQQ